MGDFFWQRTDSVDHSGDLADIVRSVNTVPSTSSPDLSDIAAAADIDSWQFQQLSADDFTTLRDPLLHELTGGAPLFERSAGDRDGYSGDGSSSSNNTAVSDLMIAQRQNVLRVGDEMNRPCSNLFSRVLQISPVKVPLSLSPRAIKPMPMVGDHGVKLEHGVQIFPRALGMKRRKSQAKKVVCVPAPAAASSRPTGEVVPSDLWAWRKYGQKPIKGSPYPRGYYRCSSSKGCSARKQVERSRTDPNMLVITYTSEHNHPWPTQRNALAGSTRAQPQKNSSTSKSSTSNLKEETNDINPRTTNSSSSLPIVKEEVINEMGNVAVDNMFYNEPVSMAGSSHPDDFFADLAELEPDPMSLIFSGSGFVGEKPEVEEEEKKKSNKGLDPFIDNMFNW